MKSPHVTQPVLRHFALLAAVAVSALSTASAQQTPALQSYDVELVIFRQLSQGATPEQWSLEAVDAGQRLRYLMRNRRHSPHRSKRRPRRQRPFHTAFVTLQTDGVFEETSRRSRR